MRRLPGIDAGFLSMETRTEHMHTLKIAVVDPSTVPGGYTFTKANEVLAARLHLLPRFRRRIVSVPFGLHHPVENVEGGNVAFVAKIHHALADGVAAVAMLMNVLESDPGAAESDPGDDVWQPEPVPSKARLVLDAVLAWLRTLVDVPGLLRRTFRGLHRMRRRRRASASPHPLPFAGPWVRWNRSLTPNRKYAMASVSLGDVKVVKSGFGTSINDVLLAVTGGALRRYLARDGELPDRSLTAGVPVALADEGTRTSRPGGDPG